MSITPLWVEKYRPPTISDYIFHDPILQEKCAEWMKDKSIPHLILSGHRGTGKTALAMILVEAMELELSDVLIINASSERGIDMFRDKITSFASTLSLSDFKIIYLEEADKLTPDAQNALKHFMEEGSDSVRFIFTCNHANKILPEIKSRCQQFQFKSIEKDDAAEYLATILTKEKVKFTLEILDHHVDVGYPDIRKMVNTIQQYTVKGVLKDITADSSNGDYILSLIPLIEADDWNAARILVCNSITSSEWDDVYRLLYDNLDKSPKFQIKEKWDEAILAIADHLYKHSFFSDPEINAAALFIELGRI